MVVTKKCTRCGIEKPTTEFYKNKKKKDGYQTWCKSCSAEKSHEWYLLNKERHKKIADEWRTKNYAKAISKQREYYEKNKESILKNEKERRDKNPEKTKEIYKRYYKAHKEARAQYQREHKDKVRAAHKKYRESHREQIRRQTKEYRERNKTQINERRLERLRHDPVFARRQRLQLAVNMAIKTAKKNGSPNKNSLAKSVTGLDPIKLWKYLLKTWEEKYGKAWNGEKYNIDHIIPCCTASTVEEIDNLFRYTNLRMLTPEDNIAKKKQDSLYKNV